MTALEQVDAGIAQVSKVSLVEASTMMDMLLDIRQALTAEQAWAEHKEQAE